ncbi:hypothetical protein LOTGIDRAFT_163017 [Lottia gigantea]|uniref:Polymerase nucleotidyl transferase domain-containing protein n=1 Tax=Lottia gigantea TaxID=225164 RepID=V4AAB1_LOTGI|nr:hypothetical protein LOTGIDRAFT_163017 [Lottia gigantea]ESO92010.1 hypothetical protein LOTGIDRAFT_163017 [Lottia gigantea]
MKKAVDSIVRQLHHMPDYSIKEVVKSGSLGKGTTVGDTADADLVIFFNGYQTMEELIAAKPKIISDIATYMNRFDQSVFSKCEKIRENEYLGQFRFQHTETNRFVEVDILPALDVVAQRMFIFLKRSSVLSFNIEKLPIAFALANQLVRL